MHTNLIILAGGASSRMKNSESLNNLSDEEIAQANNRSKGLIALGHRGRPLLDYLLYNAKKAGYQNIYLVIGEEAELFKTFYGEKPRDNDFHGLTISYAVQYVPKNRAKPFGTADALFQAVEQYPELNSQFYTVCNSDNLYSVEALSSLRKIDIPNALISYDRDSLYFPPERIARFAVATFDNENYLLDIIEKPSVHEIEKYKDRHGKVRVSMNVFKINGKDIYEYLKNCPIHPERDEKELPTAILNFLKDNPKTVLGLPRSEHVPDLTAKEDIIQVKDYLKKYYSSIQWDTMNEHKL
ncbi:nucleotidyltransferase [Fulvivirga sp. M361]|uniref:sugar phosphate nucleotidyltransferase n=1 Tax=Fulvivirga sp. M361 TaxID=2594266 RepID=UPI00117B2D49|nr:sugar phosphate nucleotidyltransferase [Fulvivirga sp. M361]TRX48468.1 nucleotidyltransferase [Fulvivirga sp. M361]